MDFWNPDGMSDTNDRYFPIFDNSADGTNVETSEGNPVWKTIYFEGLQHITNFSVILYLLF